MIVTIDGPAGTGKSTVARELAQALGFEYLDTGAMYRMIAWGVVRGGIDMDQQDPVAQFARMAKIEFDGRDAFLNGTLVTDQLRTPDVSLVASRVAQNAEVRAAMVEKQRIIAAGCDIVCEGRDQGTVVFPGAEYKFFLTAAEEIRAQRRLEELLAQGKDARFQQVLDEQRERDDRDATREVAPLKPAADAILIDTSLLTIDEVILQIQQIIEADQRFS